MANAVGLNALFEDGITNSNRIRHAWNLVEIDGTYYYTDPTNAYFKEDGEPGKELLPGQKYLFSLYTPDDTTIEDTYKNISEDDYLKEHSVCKRKSQSSREWRKNLLNVQHLLQYIMNVQTLAAYMNTM